MIYGLKKGRRFACNKPRGNAMKRGCKLLIAMALLGLASGGLLACSSSPYDTDQCAAGAKRCSSSGMPNYDSYNWWKTDDPN